jgi:hypothetical protein
LTIIFLLSSISSSKVSHSFISQEIILLETLFKICFVIALLSGLAPKSLSYQTFIKKSFIFSQKLIEIFFSFSLFFNSASKLSTIHKMISFQSG